ncbi:uncharacterized protein LOC112452132, partial [Temnothorax curvispinosus]|uniref:Uncharacterized protein LOC112452132 n=1 Tax=Temnothorax curvispinosus TaxID=300111 RepID=A0A6J1PEZ4_9HYME
SHIYAGGPSEMNATTPLYQGYKRSQMTSSAPRKDVSHVKMAGNVRCHVRVAAYMKTEVNRLTYRNVTQLKIRAELYSGVRDYLDTREQTEGRKAGIPVRVSSSVRGSPRNMQERYQAARFMVRKFEKPDRFLTVTGTPQSPSRKENLAGGQVDDRPDLVAKIFNLDVKELRRDLRQKERFGKHRAYVGVREFQKRGVPPLPLLARLGAEKKPKPEKRRDKMVWTEIPDEERSPELTARVLRHMRHGSCSDRSRRYLCIRKDGKCTKGYPKNVREETEATETDDLMYQRRTIGKKYRVRGKKRTTRGVVPSSPYLLRNDDRHRTLEICSSVKSVDDFDKYIHKGFACAARKVQTRDGTRLRKIDKVNAVMDASDVGTPEARWRLNGHEQFMKSPTVRRLAVPLPTRQRIYFKEGTEEQAAQSAQKRDTKLTAWFNVTQDDEKTKPFVDAERASHMVYEKKEANGKLRQKGTEKIRSRFDTVSIKDTERYYLRVLLLHIKGTKCYETLRTVNGVLSETFKAATKTRTLRDADDHGGKTLEEVKESQRPAQRRELVAYICIYGTPTDNAGYVRKYSLDVYRGTTGTSCVNFNVPKPKPVKRTKRDAALDEERSRGEDFVLTVTAEQKHVYALVRR